MKTPGLPLIKKQERRVSDRDTFVETFCKYVEDDDYEWLKDNFKSFFNHGVPDWKWVREKIKAGEDNSDSHFSS